MYPVLYNFNDSLLFFFFLQLCEQHSDKGTHVFQSCNGGGQLCAASFLTSFDVQEMSPENMRQCVSRCSEIKGMSFGSGVFCIEMNCFGCSFVQILLILLMLYRVISRCEHVESKCNCVLDMHVKVI